MRVFSDKPVAILITGFNNLSEASEWASAYSNGLEQGMGYETDRYDEPFACYVDNENYNQPVQSFVVEDPNGEKNIEVFELPLYPVHNFSRLTIKENVSEVPMSSILRGMDKPNAILLTGFNTLVDAYNWKSAYLHEQEYMVEMSLASEHSRFRFTISGYFPCKLEESIVNEHYTLVEDSNGKQKELCILEMKVN